MQGKQRDKSELLKATSKAISQPRNEHCRTFQFPSEVFCSAGPDLLLCLRHQVCLPRLFLIDLCLLGAGDYR